MAATCVISFKDIDANERVRERLDAGSQAARYAARCNTTVDIGAYEEGYREGLAQRPRVPSF